jgi:hypothetical protein
MLDDTGNSKKKKKAKKKIQPVWISMTVSTSTTLREFRAMIGERLVTTTGTRSETESISTVSGRQLFMNEVNVYDERADFIWTEICSRDHLCSDTLSEVFKDRLQPVRLNATLPPSIWGEFPFSVLKWLYSSDGKRVIECDRNSMCECTRMISGERQRSRYLISPLTSSFQFHLKTSAVINLSVRLTHTLNPVIIYQADDVGNGGVIPIPLKLLQVGESYELSLIPSSSRQLYVEGSITLHFQLTRSQWRQILKMCFVSDENNLIDLICQYLDPIFSLVPTHRLFLL